MTEPTPSEAEVRKEESRVLKLIQLMRKRLAATDTSSLEDEWDDEGAAREAPDEDAE